MAEVCVTRHTGITDGQLSLEPWSAPRIVYEALYPSGADGDVTQTTTLPGKLMIDTGIVSWTNGSPLDAMIRVWIDRGARQWTTSNPNVIQIRDRLTYAIGGQNPAVPDTTSVYTGQSGGGLDCGANAAATPYVGIYSEMEDPQVHEEWLGPIPPGDVLRVWYRCYLWTPPPWSSNANAGSPRHTAYVNSMFLRLMAFPTQDESVAG